MEVEDTNDADVACVFCGEPIEPRDVEPLTLTMESEGPERSGFCGGTFFAHVACWIDKTDALAGGGHHMDITAALLRLHPPGSRGASAETYHRARTP